MYGNVLVTITITLALAGAAFLGRLGCRRRRILLTRSEVVEVPHDWNTAANWSNQPTSAIVPNNYTLQIAIVIMM